MVPLAAQALRSPARVRAPMRQARCAGTTRWTTPRQVAVAVCHVQAPDGRWSRVPAPAGRSPSPGNIRDTSRNCQHDMSRNYRLERLATRPVAWPRDALSGVTAGGGKCARIGFLRAEGCVCWAAGSPEDLAWGVAATALFAARSSRACADQQPGPAPGVPDPGAAPPGPGGAACPYRLGGAVPLAAAG